MWKRVFEHLADDADNEYAMIDSTIVRAISTGWRGQKDGEKRSGAAAAAEHEDPRDGGRAGQPDRLRLSPGQAHDLEGRALLPDLAADALIADKALMPTSACSSRWRRPARRR